MRAHARLRDPPPVNESSLTGEGDDKLKDASEDPFLFSGCNVKTGAGKGLVYLVGVRSQWGKLKASLRPSLTKVQKSSIVP